MEMKQLPSVDTDFESTSDVVTKLPVQSEICESLPLPQHEQLTEDEQKDITLKVDYMKDNIGLLLGIDSDNQFLDAITGDIEEFVKDVTKEVLFVYLKCNDPVSLEATSDVSQLRTSVAQMCYFLKDNSKETSTPNLTKNVQFGLVNKDEINSLFLKMVNIYQNRILDHEKQEIGSEFVEDLRVMVSSVAKTFAISSECKTLLYLPEQTRDKDNTIPLQNTFRLEKLALHWQQQIKHFLNCESTNDEMKSVTVMTEIEMWKNRLKVLNEANAQMSAEHFMELRNKLKERNSPFDAEFDKLPSMLMNEIKNAEYHLSLLQTLRKHYEQFLTDHYDTASLHLANLIDQIARLWKDQSLVIDQNCLQNLLEKVCQAVILRCTAEISTEKIAKGYVKTSINGLTDSIELCRLCRTMIQQVSTQNNWKHNDDDLYLSLDAFIQRCFELMQICESTKLFARWEDGHKKSVDSSVERHSLMAEILTDVEEGFDAFLGSILQDHSNFLDIHDTNWMKIMLGYEVCKSKIEDIVSNAIACNLNDVTSVIEGMFILSSMSHLLTNQNILEAVISHIDTMIYKLQYKDITKAKIRFSKLPRSSEMQFKQLAVQAYDAHKILSNVADSMTVICEAKWLPSTPIGDETKSEFDNFENTIDNYVTRKFTRWCSSRSRESLKMIHEHLIRKKQGSQLIIESSLSSETLAAYESVAIWKELGKDIYQSTGDAVVSEKCDNILRINNKLQPIVDDYNKVIVSLNKDELEMFEERIDVVLQKFTPGFYDYSWSSCDHIPNDFFLDCQLAIVNLQETLIIFENANRFIAAECQLMREKSLYTGELELVNTDQYIDEMIKCHGDFCVTVTMTHSKIREKLEQLIDLVFEDIEKICKPWWKYVEKIDKLLESAVKCCLDLNLNELHSYLKECHLTFIVSSSQTANENKLRALIAETNGILRKLSNSLDKLSRLSDVMTNAESHRKAIYLAIQEDETLRRIQYEITDTMEKTWSAFRKQMSEWQPYWLILEVNQETLFESYVKQEPSIDDILRDITSYRKLSSSVTSLESVKTIGFLKMNYDNLNLDEQNSFSSNWIENMLNLLREMFAKNIANDIMNKVKQEIFQGNKLVPQQKNNKGLGEGQLVRSQCTNILVYLGPSNEVASCYLSKTKD